MRPIYLTFPALAAPVIAGPFPLDQYISPGQTSTTINVLNGTTPTATVYLEFTADNILDPDTTTVIWQPYTASPFAIDGSYNFTQAGAVEAVISLTPKALRVRVTAVSGAPDVKINIIQAGIGGT